MAGSKLAIMFAGAALLFWFIGAHAPAAFLGHFTVFVLASAAMMIQGYSNVQLFQAKAQILIEDERSTAVPGITSTDNTYYEDPEPYYKTQYKILTGRDLTRRVIKKLHLEAVPEYNGTAAAPAGVPFVSDLKQRVARLEGMTLYLRDSDPPGKSSCNAQCAINWPPQTSRSIASSRT